MASCDVSVVLPHGGRYSANANPGAIELCVKDFVSQSRFYDDLVVLGNTISQPFNEGRFLPLASTIIRKRNQWYQSLKDNIEALKPKVIQVQQHPPTAAFLKKNFPKLPVILHMHDTQVPSFFVKAFFRRHAMRTADAIITNSAFTKDHMCKVNRVPKDRVRIIYNALHPPLAPVLPKHTQNIICVAGMLERKGPHLFLQAVIPLLKQYPDWTAYFVCWDCPGTKDTYRKKIQTLLEDAPSNLIHLPWMTHKEILKHFAKAEIAVVPSQISEGFGRTALEAALHGAAIVSSGYGALKEVTGNHALYPTVQTPFAYRQQIEKLITETSFRMRRQQSAYDYAKDKFCLSKITACYDDILAAAMAHETLPFSWQDETI